MLVDVGSDVELCNGENMMKIKPFTNVSFLRATIILCVIPQCLAALSDKQLCYDPNCSEPISLARTILAYRANDREVMSFNNNAEVKVFSKGAGKRTDLWGVEINGKRGFAPEKFLNEYKILRRDLSHEVPVYKFNDKANKVQPEKLESTGKGGSESHTLLKDKLSRDDNATLSLNSVDGSIVEESHATNADSISPSYEVIDGTTVYLENTPSVQPSLVAEVAHATALPHEQAPAASNSKIVHERLSSDENAFIDNKKLQPVANGVSGELEGVQLSTDTQRQTGSDVPPETPEAIIGSTLDPASTEDTWTPDGTDNSEGELFESVELTEESDSGVEESAEDNEKEKDSEHVESDGIFASITKTFKILSSSVETVVAKSTAAKSSEDAAAPDTAVYSNLQLEEQVSESIEDAATEEIPPSTQIKLESSIDQGFIGKDKVESQQEIVYASTESATVPDEQINEAPTIILEHTTVSDVPSSNNFVHENNDKPAKELPTTADGGFAFAKADVENIQMQETSEAERVARDVRADGAITSAEEDSTILSGLQGTAATETTTTQSSDVIEPKLPESGEAHLEKTKKDYKEIIGQADKTAEILETVSLPSETAESIATESSPDSHSVENVTIEENHSAADIQFNKESIVHSNVNKIDNLANDTNSDNVPIESNEFSNSAKSSVLGPEQSIDSSQESMMSEQTMTLNEGGLAHQDVESQIVGSVKEEEILPEYGDHMSNEDKVSYENGVGDDSLEKPESASVSDEMEVAEDKICMNDHECVVTEATTKFLNQMEDVANEEDDLIDVTLDHNYWKTLMCLCVTAFTTLVFTLGYYCIENTRRDGQLIARINKLEKELLVSTKECEVLSENLKSIKDKLHCIEDESFGSNEMVVSLKADLEMSQSTKVELEEQVTMLEKDLENATEAGLELERMLREVLSSNNEVNPLAQSVEDLQARLNAQQAANESLTNALNLKAQEIETLSADLVSAKEKFKKLQIEYLQTQDELTTQKNLQSNIEQTLTDKVHSLEEQVGQLSTEKSSLYKELREKEVEVRELMEIISQVKSNNLDLEKLYDVSHIKIEAAQLREERDELKVRLSDVDGAHQLLEEHMKLVKEEIIALSDQCKIAEREKKDAETRLEVLSKFFQDKETERQKEEAIWLQKQGEVMSTVERLHTLQNEIQNYKQQIEMLKREIVDQEREYKNQISALETKTHEQWVTTRQNERRLEESKAEASQLRNRLTLVEKNLNEIDPEAKLHRLEANGETATSPSLFIGAESSSSPVMFSGSSGVPPPPPPSYLHCFPYLPPLPPAAASGLPPYDISQRPPPLGGRLSSPPPALHRPPVSGGRYENAGSPPPPMSPPHLLPRFDHHRSPPPPPFGGDHIPPLPPPGSILPPPLGAAHPWGEESLPHPRNSGFHPHQREQRARNHKGSLHSSGESLDKAHHGKV